MEMLELRDLHKTFNPGTVNEKVALNGVSLTMEAGDFATIVGSNGAGKSTLFNAITGGFIADEGSITLGGEAITFISLPEWFTTIFVTTGVWQGLGWGTILYLAAMSGINTELYEAAELDGANRFQQCLHVTIPAILPTISTLLVLNIGSLCGSAAFEKVFLLYTPTTYETADIIATYVYRMGLGSGNYSYATAVGLFQGVINLVLLTVANKVSSWLTGSGLW